MLHEGSMSEYKNFEGDRKLVRHRIFHGNQGLIQSLRSKERSVLTVLMTEVPKMFVSVSPSFNFCFFTFFVQQYGSPPSKEETVEAGNSCPICQEELKDPIKLRACKVLYYWHQWLTINPFATLLCPGWAITLLQWMRALCDISHGEKELWSISYQHHLTPAISPSAPWPCLWETACCCSWILFFSVKSNLALLWFCLTSPCYWSRKLAPLSQLIRFTTKSKCDTVARVFPRFRQFAAFTLSLHWLPRIFFLFLICRWDNFGLFFFNRNAL